MPEGGPGPAEAAGPAHSAPRPRKVSGLPFCLRFQPIAGERLQKGDDIGDIRLADRGRPITHQSALVRQPARDEIEHGPVAYHAARLRNRHDPDRLGEIADRAVMKIGCGQRHIPQRGNAPKARSAALFPRAGIEVQAVFRIVSRSERGEKPVASAAAIGRQHDSRS